MYLTPEGYRMPILDEHDLAMVRIYERNKQQNPSAPRGEEEPQPQGRPCSPEELAELRRCGILDQEGYDKALEAWKAYSQEVSVEDVTALVNAVPPVRRDFNREADFVLDTADDSLEGYYESQDVEIIRKLSNNINPITNQPFEPGDPHFSRINPSTGRAFGET